MAATLWGAGGGLAHNTHNINCTILIDLKYFGNGQPRSLYMLWKTLTCRTTLFLPGGEDFDQRVMDHFIKLYKKKKGKDIRKDNRAVQKLRREVEKAKRALSSQHQVRVEVESLFDGEDFSEQLTRAKFEELNMVSWKVLCVVSGWMQRTSRC